MSSDDEEFILVPCEREAVKPTEPGISTGKNKTIAYNPIHEINTDLYT